MKLYQYNANYDKSSEDFKAWKIVNEVVMKNMTPEMKAVWMINGYNGIAELAPTYFGFNRLYRDDNHTMTFEFTEQQWTMFALRWL